MIKLVEYSEMAQDSSLVPFLTNNFTYLGGNIVAINRISELPQKAKDLTKQKFGKLTVKSFNGWNKWGNICWLCDCICGREIVVRGGNLCSGHTKSCGCLQREKTIENLKTHGMSKAPIYDIWISMIQRCENPKCYNYRYYGGRGIKVYERWHSFENFYEDMGDKPEGKSLDRWPDNDGNYELGNVRWATPHEQRINSRPISCGSTKQKWFFAFNVNTGEWDENNNQADFARQHGLNQSKISACLLNKRKTYKDWTFQWI